MTEVRVGPAAILPAAYRQGGSSRNNEPDQARADDNSSDQGRLGAVRQGPIGTASPTTFFQVISALSQDPAGQGTRPLARPSMATHAALLSAGTRPHQTEQARPIGCACRPARPVRVHTSVNNCPRLSLVPTLREGMPSATLRVVLVFDFQRPVGCHRNPGLPLGRVAGAGESPRGRIEEESRSTGFLGDVAQLLAHHRVGLKDSRRSDFEDDNAERRRRHSLAESGKESSRSDGVIGGPAAECRMG